MAGYRQKFRFRDTRRLRPFFLKFQVRLGLFNLCDIGPDADRADSLAFRGEKRRRIVEAGYVGAVRAPQRNLVGTRNAMLPLCDLRVEYSLVLLVDEIEYFFSDNLLGRTAQNGAHGRIHLGRTPLQIDEPKAFVGSFKQGIHQVLLLHQRPLRVESLGQIEERRTDRILSVPIDDERPIVNGKFVSVLFDRHQIIIGRRRFATQTRLVIPPHAWPFLRRQQEFGRTDGQKILLSVETKHVEQCLIGINRLEFRVNIDARAKLFD